MDKGNSTCVPSLVPDLMVVLENSEQAHEETEIVHLLIVYTLIHPASLG